ncbi:unnamed protein product, partial [Brenthis ino]
MLSRYVVSQVKHNSYFLVGLGIGLWLALATVPLEEDVAACDGAATVTTPDDFEPQREERPLGPAGQSGRSVQRPRYYSTELGMRGGLLAGVLSSEEVLETRAAALNKTAARLLPALRFFITASTLQAAPGRANVVGFTDTREMLKPFHALKYLADNYLEEYDFFFLISDTSFVNAHRLLELVSKLSVSQDLYMGTVADDDTHYCTLEGGILLSNSVLRAVHGELDWCVRNSYSPQHHENIGRCVLHAAHLPCAATAQGQRYAARTAAGALRPALADAVAAHPALHPRDFHRLHAYVARVRLQRAAGASSRAPPPRSARAATRAASATPRGRARCATTPASRRHRPPPGHTPFDHLSWTRFNETHALLLGAREAAAPLPRAHRTAVARVLRAARAWAAARWGVARGTVALAEGAWRWAPPRALRYRLLLRVGGALRLAEAARPLGAARLAPARYVTESARVHAVLALPAAAAAPAAAFLRRYEAVCRRDANTELTVVIVSGPEALSEQQAAALAALRAAAAAAAAGVLDAAAAGGSGDGARRGAAARPALAAALPRLARDALVLLLLAPEAEFNEDFLNRVRMNTISGEQWFAPVAFHRYAQAPPAPGAPPAQPGAPPAPAPAPAPRAAADVGRFAADAAPVALSFYRQDYEAALQQWRGAADAPPAALLAAAPLRALRAPEPALLLPPPAPPCAPVPAPAQCLRRERDAGFADVVLGARHTLAKTLLQRQAELA